MRKYIEPVLLIMLSCLFIYLLGAFTNATFNITLWSAYARFIIAVLMLFATFLILLSYYINKTF